MARGMTPKEMEAWFSDDTNFGRIAPHLESLGVTPDRYIRLAVISASQNPKLRECDPWTIAFALIEAAALGLEPNGVLGHAYLVPYWNNTKKILEAKLQVGYQGLVELGYRSGRVASSWARAIYTKDEYEILDGTGGGVIHKPYIPEVDGDPRKLDLESEEQNRGSIVAVYSIANILPEGVAWEWMPIADVEAIRRRAKSSTGFSPWDSDYEAMARKTVLRRNFWRNVPLDAKGQAAIAMDQNTEGGASIPLSLIDPDLVPREALELYEGEDAEASRKRKRSGVAGLKDRVKKKNGASLSSDMVNTVRGLAQDHADEDEIGEIEAAIEAGDGSAISGWVDALTARGEGA